MLVLLVEAAALLAVDDPGARLDGVADGVADDIIVLLGVAEVLVDTPVPTTARFGMMPSGNASAPMDAKPKTKASMIATSLVASAIMCRTVVWRRRSVGSFTRLRLDAGQMNDRCEG